MTDATADRWIAETLERRLTRCIDMLLAHGIATPAEHDRILLRIQTRAEVAAIADEASRTYFEESE
jgi:hypothetical protein